MQGGLLQHADAPTVLPTAGPMDYAPTILPTVRPMDYSLGVVHEIYIFIYIYIYIFTYIYIYIYVYRCQVCGADLLDEDAARGGRDVQRELPRLVFRVWLVRRRILF